MKSYKSYFYSLLLLAIISFSYVRTQQMDIYREIARSQQQIMTVYKYLLTEYIHELDVTELTTRIIDSMLSNFDPYTEYYQQKDLEDLSLKTEGEFSGVGLEIYMYDDQLTVISPIEGSPASRSGIYTGDAIMNIDGEPTSGLELKDATSKIRGKAGTEVILTIKKPNTGEVQDYPIIRDYNLFYERVQAHYKRLDFLGVNYGLETQPIDMNSEYEDGHFYVTLNKGVKDLKLFYQINQDETVLYDSTFIISESANIKTWAIKNDVSYGDSLEIELYEHKGLDARIANLKVYSKTYDGGGDDAIVNGLRGGLNFRDGHWQGYFGTDFEATITLDSIQRIDSVISSFYQYNLSWIFMPKQILVYTSVDGDNYYKRAKLSPSISVKQEGQFFEEFVLTFPEVEAKHVKIQALNYGVCPDWHPAAGSKSWLFVDEVRLY